MDTAVAGKMLAETERLFVLTNAYYRQCLEDGAGQRAMQAYIELQVLQQARAALQKLAERDDGQAGTATR